MVNTIDCRGMACPLPIITTRKALSEHPKGATLQIIVDNELAARNVTRYLNDFGVSIAFEAKGSDFIGSFTNPGADNAPEVSLDTASCTPQEQTAPAMAQADTLKPIRPVIFCLTNHLGQGDEQLGTLLMKGFLSTLANWNPLPSSILLMNSGVLLTCENSGALDTLKQLENLGIDIRVCGMCADFYNIRDNIRVGHISNMVEISTIISQAQRLIRL